MYYQIRARSAAGHSAWSAPAQLMREDLFHVNARSSSSPRSKMVLPETDEPSLKTTWSQSKTEPAGLGPQYVPHMPLPPASTPSPTRVTAQASPEASLHQLDESIHPSAEDLAAMQSLPSARTTAMLSPPPSASSFASALPPPSAPEFAAPLSPPSAEPHSLTAPPNAASAPVLPYVAFNARGCRLVETIADVQQQVQAAAREGSLMLAAARQAELVKLEYDLKMMMDAGFAPAGCPPVALQL